MNKQLVAYIKEKYGLVEELAEILVEKGITNRSLVDAFFNPNLSELLPAESLPDGEKAIERILSAVGKKKKIVVWGHEDADGVTSVSIMLMSLRLLGANPDYYIPSKRTEGHGLYKEAIDKFKEKGVEFILTVDCCSNDKEVINYAKDRGIEIVVTDHHEISQDTEGFLIVNPKLGGDSYRYLAGCGVAFKIAWGMLSLKAGINLMDIKEKYPELIVFAAIGTIADKVPPISENAIFIKEGEELIKSLHLPFIEVLRKKYDREPSWDILVSVVSSGQSVNGKIPTVDLLLTRSMIEAEEIIEPLIKSSEEWIKNATNYLEEAKKKIGRIRDYILVDLEDTEPRYLGFIANQLKQMYDVPAIVLGRKEDGVGTAEVRAPKGFDSLKLLEYLSPILINYGGHKLASGFSIEDWDIPVLFEEVERYFKKHPFSNNIFADLKISGVPDSEYLDHLEELGKLGLEIRVLINHAPLGEIKKLLEEHNIIDQERLLDIYTPQTKVKILIETSQEGLRILKVIPL